MQCVFAPGCALMLYKPHLADRVQAVLAKEVGGLPRHLTCCRHAPGLPWGTEVINVCPGCDRRYRNLYKGVTTRSLWEVLAHSRDFPFPDYRGRPMAVQDACPTRDQERVHEAVRTLLGKMNIQIVEPARTRTKGVCCGDTFYGTLPKAQVIGRMRDRAAEMPEQEVVVYCVSCVKAMHLGGRKPRYLVDLLFGEDTTPGVCDPDSWHAEVDRFIGTH